VKKKKQHVPLALVLAIVILIAAAAGYMLAIRPKKAEVQKLDTEISEVQTEVAAAKRALEEAQEPAPQTSIKVADVVELAKAMPDQADMAGVIFELNAAAESAGVSFTAITPGPPVAGAGYAQYPLTLTFEGTYYELTELVYQLRHLVTVRDGVLDANGRMFTLDALDWHEDDELKFPFIEASLVVSAYVYGNDPSLVVPTADGSAPAAPAPATQDGSAPATTTTSETTTTTTAPAETTTTSSTVDASQQAAGVTP
jgi:Tfp pilus assembly protein PilO